MLSTFFKWVQSSGLSLVKWLWPLITSGNFMISINWWRSDGDTWNIFWFFYLYLFHFIFISFLVSYYLVNDSRQIKDFCLLVSLYATHSQISKLNLKNLKCIRIMQQCSCLQSDNLSVSFTVFYWQKLQLMSHKNRFITLIELKLKVIPLIISTVATPCYTSYLLNWIVNS